MGFRSSITEFLSNFCWDMGVDMGSSNTLVYVKDRGVVVDEPTVLARPKKRRWTGLSAPRVRQAGPIAFGFRAKEMINREPRQVEVVEPIYRGMIADLAAAQDLMAYYLRLVYEIPSRYPKIFKPRVVVGVPGEITDVQKRAVKSIFFQAGAARVMLVEQAVLAAVGLGLPIERSVGLVIVDVGGGKSEVSVVSGGGVVLAKNIGVAGKDLDEAVANWVKMKYGLLIGANTAERVKMEIADVGENISSKQTVVRGRDLETGLPKSIKLTSAEVGEAVAMQAGKIAKVVARVLDETAPELMEDILKRGIVMVGRGSLLPGLDKMIERETKIGVSVADDCGLCVVKGCGELMTDLNKRRLVSLVSAYDQR